ncbi:MAG: COX15/CtaA family protein [Burkholderiales bacterium]
MRRDGAIAAWLLACCALVIGMIVVGGITRLTHSGLSIVEWQPLIGAIPPLTEADWQLLFEKYQQTPEYQQVNAGMGLEGFKGIFWWEYIHRLLGRLIGVAFFVPYLWFLARRAIRGALAWKLAGIFVLGGLQGAMGWYMVKSGLVDDPRVSHFRLTAHLALAFLILAAMLWVALDLLSPRARVVLDRRVRKALRMARGVVFLVFLMVLTGGLVAGLRAGKAYNTFPLMNGHWIPPEILQLDPWWMNLFWNVATVQFDHRLGAWLLALFVPWLWLRCRAAPDDAQFASSVLLFLVALQIGLGIATLLLRVPVELGVAHQGTASLVLCAAVWTMHALKGPVRNWTD